MFGYRYRGLYMAAQERELALLRWMRTFAIAPLGSERR